MGTRRGVGPALGLVGYLKCLQQLSCVKKAMRQECTEPCAQRPDTRGTGMTGPLLPTSILTPFPLLLPPGQAGRAVWPEGVLSN